METIPLKTKVDLGTPEHEVVSNSTNGITGANESDEVSKSPENEKKKKKTLSLKTRIKRYSTKKVSKHHVEEIEVDFNSDDSSGSSADEEAIDNV